MPHEVHYKSGTLVNGEPEIVPIRYSSRVSLNTIKSLPDIEFNAWTKDSFDFSLDVLSSAGSTLPFKCQRLSLSEGYIVAEYVEDTNRGTWTELQEIKNKKIPSLSALTDFDVQGNAISRVHYRTTLLAILPVCFDAAGDKVVRYHAIFTAVKQDT